jgi:hypothetical protein
LGDPSSLTSSLKKGQEGEAAPVEHPSLLHSFDVSGVLSSFHALTAYMDAQHPIATVILFVVLPLSCSAWWMIGVAGDGTLRLKVTVAQTNQLLDGYLPYLLLVVCVVTGLQCMQEVVDAMGECGQAVRAGVWDGCRTRTSAHDNGNNGSNEDGNSDETQQQEEELRLQRRRTACWCTCGQNIVLSLLRVSRAVFTCGCVVLLLATSSVTFVGVSRPIQAKVPAYAWDLYSATSAHALSSSYGLFRRMTGVGDQKQVARPEITL